MTECPPDDSSLCRVRGHRPSVYDRRFTWMPVGCNWAAQGLGLGNDDVYPQVDELNMRQGTATIQGPATSLVGNGTERLQGQYRWLLGAATVGDNPVIEAMSRYREQTRWFYSRDPKYGFHARLAVPPEVAVLPRKRFETGQIDYARILQYLRHYRPEQVLLTTAQELHADWMEFLNGDYVKVYEDLRHSLYVSTDVVAGAPAE